MVSCPMPTMTIQTALESSLKGIPRQNFTYRRVQRKTVTAGKISCLEKYIGIRRGYLETYKDRIVYADGDLEVIPGVTLLAHRTPGLADTGRKAGMYVKKNGRWKPDDFSHEQSLVFDTKEGLVIFNSCSHGGADVIIREAETAFPGKQIYGLIGGFHLFRSEDQEVRELADRIKKTGIRRICTGHCTGERAMEILKEELGDMAEQIYTGFEIEV